MDSGSAAARIPVAPGTYTVRLKAGAADAEADGRGEGATRGGRPARRASRSQAARLSVSRPSRREDRCNGKSSFSQSLGVWPLFARTSARLQAAGGGRPNADLAEQEQLSLRVRDDITKLSDTVSRLRAIKKQIDLRKDLLKDRDDAQGAAQAIRGARQEARRHRGEAAQPEGEDPLRHLRGDAAARCSTRSSPGCSQPDRRPTARRRRRSWNWPTTWRSNSRGCVSPVRGGREGGRWQAERVRQETRRAGAVRSSRQEGGFEEVNLALRTTKF